MATKRTRSIARTGDVELASGSQSPAPFLPIASQDDTKRASSSKPKTKWPVFLNAVVAAVNAADKFKTGNQLLLGAAPTDEENIDSIHKGERLLRMAHDGLVQQLSTYGILLILLAGIMSVAILQPPGSFDPQGHIRISPLVACYLLFASLSFLLACTGLYAVMAGSASLFSPMFYAEPCVISEGRDDIKTQKEIVRDIVTQKEIIADNVFRVKRLKTYLGCSLMLCMTSFACGAFAVLGPLQRNLWMAVGTMVAGTFVLAFEGWMTWRGPALPDTMLQKLQEIIH